MRSGFILLALLAAPAWAQGSIDSCVVELRLHDRATPRVIFIGVHERATYEWDFAIGETPWPPSPIPPIGDFRVLDLPGRPRFPTTGGPRDLRPYRTGSQVDSFLVMIRPNDGRFPVQMSWDSDLAGRCDSLIIQSYPNPGGFRVNAARIGGTSVELPALDRLLLILYGPKSGRTRH